MTMFPRKVSDAIESETLYKANEKKKKNTYSKVKFPKGNSVNKRLLLKLKNIFTQEKSIFYTADFVKMLKKNYKTPQTHWRLLFA